MAVPKILLFCAHALLIKSAFSQCLGLAGIGGPGYSGLTPGLAGPYGAGSCGGVASTGGGFIVNSFSPLPPTGISLRSENAIEGSLSVGGEVPFLGTVALEGILPTSGAGAISYGCGDGAVGITSEGPIATGITTPGSYGPGIAGPGYGTGAVGSAFGTGAVGPAFGPGLGAGQLYGSGLAPGYNGFGIGCGAL